MLPFPDPAAPAAAVAVLRPDMPPLLQRVLDALCFHIQDRARAVSYTHLDVYKRQGYNSQLVNGPVSESQLYMEILFTEKIHTFTENVLQ